MRAALALAIVLAATASAAADVGAFKRAWGAAARQQGEAGRDAQLKALELLTAQPEPKGAELLLKLSLAGELDVAVRDGAEQALIRCLAEPAVTLWAGEAVAGKERKAERRVVLCRALGARLREDPRAGDLLLPVLEDKEPAVVSAALRGLAGLEKKPVVSALVGLLQRAEGRVAGDARRALEALTGQRQGSPAEWQSWWEGQRASFRFGATEQRAEPGERVRTQTRLRPPGRGGRTLYEEIDSSRVLFVVDVSHSMQIPCKDVEGQTRTRLEYVKQALIGALRDQLGPGDEFSILSFGSEVQLWRGKAKLAKAGGSSVKKAAAWVEGLRLAGDTNVYLALETAFKIPKIDTIYFLSDGNPSQGKTIITSEILAHVRRWNAGRGVRICTIGFLAGDPKAVGIVQDKKMAKDFLEALAKDNQGTARFFE